MYNGLIFLRTNWQMSFHLSVEFCNYAVLCHTQIFDSDWVGLAKNLINEVFRVMVVMAVDYPILCGPCTDINIPLFNWNKNNVITCHLLCLLECRWSHSHCDRCIHMKNLCLQSLLHGKNFTENLVLYTLNQQYSVKEHKRWWKKKPNITFSAVQT